jgi:hypothetical protein
MRPARGPLRSQVASRIMGGMIMPFVYGFGALIVAVIVFIGGYAEERRNAG